MSEAPIIDYGTVSSCNRFAEWVENAVSGADYLRDQLSSVDDLARLLTVVRDAQRKLAMLERETEGDLAAAVRECGEREPEVPGVGVLRLSYRRKTEWDSPLLVASVIKLAGERAMQQLDDPTFAAETALDEVEASLIDILSTCLRITPTTPWKAGGLRELDLEPDDYRATQVTGTSVRIVEPDRG